MARLERGMEENQEGMQMNTLKKGRKSMKSPRTTIECQNRKIQ